MGHDSSIWLDPLAIKGMSEAETSSPARQQLADPPRDGPASH